MNDMPYSLFIVKQMETKSEALKLKLLNTFDYAWNASINGAGHPDDVLQRLKRISSKPARLILSRGSYLSDRSKLA